MPLEVFYSYAHEDESLRDELDEHLATLKRQGAIVGWHDRAIGAGREWSHQIDEHVRSAHIILLLISSSFLASEYCHDIEMRLALERHARGEAVVIPIILRPVDWSGAEFAHLQALPRNAKPVTTWSNQDEAFLDIALGIRRVVETFGESRAPGGRPAAAPAVAPSARVLDAAIPSHIVKDEATELQVLIRLPSSPGLRGLLADDDEADAREEDVSSKDFKITFPIGPGGVPEALRAKVLLTSPDFKPARQEKVLLVPPDGDSELAAFLLTPRRLGKLKILVELFWDDVTRAPRRLLTQCVAEATSVPGDVSKHLVQIPLDVASTPERPNGPARVEALSAAPQARGPWRPLEYSSGGIGAAPVVALPSRAPAPKAAGKLGLAALSSAGVGAAIWFTLGLPAAPPESPPNPSLESCYEKVFKQANIEKTSGLVDATLALLNGNISAKTSGERVALYRELDSAAVRQSIDGCNQQYNHKGLEVPIVVNLMASHQPVADARISLRNRLSSPVLTGVDGKASLSVPLAAIEKDTVPLAVDWIGARFDFDATLSDLERGKPLQLDDVGTLEISVVTPSCNPKVASLARRVTLQLPENSSAHVWTPDTRRDPTAPLRADVVNGLAKFQYRGSLGAFQITVEGDGVRERYPSPPSPDQFELVFPKDCPPPPRKESCPTLEDAVQARLARCKGASVGTVTITPTAGGFDRSIAVCNDLTSLFEPKWANCKPFVAQVRID